jgi:hypothetical protein
VRKGITSVALLIVSIVGVTTARADDANATSCASHFASEGSFFSGKKYTTWLEFPAVTKADAYARISTSVAKDGWSIVNADKDAGVLSAAQNVSYGKGSQAPMVIVVEVLKEGSKATATFRTGGGQTAKEETIRAKLCTYLTAASAP